MRVHGTKPLQWSYARVIGEKIEIIPLKIIHEFMETIF